MRPLPAPDSRELRGHPSNGATSPAKPGRTALVAVSASMTLFGAALFGGAPTASAEIILLDNGITVDIGAENPDGSRRITVTTVYPGDDIINVGSTGHSQFERDVEDHVASFIVNREQTDVSVQQCQKRGLFPLAHCGKISTFQPYEGAAPPPVQEAPVEPPLPPVIKFPEAPPPEDLTVEFGVGDTGVTLKVINRSAVALQCTYDSDLGEAAVAVPASGSAEVFIAARRQFADHPGTLTCDNGTRADAFVRY